MSAKIDRLLPVCELLLGAAYADDDFHEREKKTIVELLGKLLEQDELPKAISAAIDSFDPKTFDVAAACAEFSEDAPVDKTKLLELISAVSEADDVHDFAEDDYLRSVAKALELDDDALEGIAISYEVEELSTKLRAITEG